MVGTTGFEPATSRTPSVRATRLRHVPLRTSSIRAKAKLSNSEEKAKCEERRAKKVSALLFALCANSPSSLSQVTPTTRATLMRVSLSLHVLQPYSQRHYEQTSLMAQLLPLHCHR